MRQFGDYNRENNSRLVTDNSASEFVNKFYGDNWRQWRNLGDNGLKIQLDYCGVWIHLDMNDIERLKNKKS